MAVSPGDQLLYPEKKKTKAERDAEADEVDSAHADSEHLKVSLTFAWLMLLFGMHVLCAATLFHV